MILLLGGNGYVGSAIQKNLTGRGLPFTVASRMSSDYSNPNVLVKMLRELRPEFLINAAGYTGSPTSTPVRFTAQNAWTETLFCRA
jgi:dTDP-4-dehydrorhamnose reductase